MYVTWQILIGGFLAFCAGFSCVCVASGWLIKIIKAVKKPAKDIHDMLKNDDERIKEIEEELAYISSSIGVLMRSNLVMLAHMRTNNATGKMEKMEHEITDFLTQTR